MKLPTQVDILRGLPAWSELYEEALRIAPTTKLGREICATLVRDRSAETIREIRALMPAKKFESYQPDALERRSMFRFNRLKTLLPQLLNNDKPIRLLDLGSGRGELLRFFLRERENLTTIGLDVDVSLFEKKKLEDSAYENILFLSAPAENIPIPSGSVDLVTGYNSMEHFDDPRAVFDECLRVLRPGGVMYFYFGPPWNSPFGPHLHPKFPLPYFHHFFNEDAVKEGLGITTDDPYIGKNRWSLADFDRLFLEHDQAECVAYRYELTWEHLWLAREIPSAFEKLSPPELTVRAIEVACKRPGDWAPVTSVNDIALPDPTSQTLELKLAKNALAGARASLDFELPSRASLSRVDFEISGTGPIDRVDVSLSVASKVVASFAPLSRGQRVSLVLPNARAAQSRLTATARAHLTEPVELTIRARL